MIITVNEFAKTHNIATKDLLELSQGLGFPIKDASSELSEDAQKSLLRSLNQHLQGLKLNTIKSVSSVVGAGKSIQVTTKHRDFKPFDVAALKEKIKVEKKEEPVMQTAAVDKEQSKLIVDSAANEGLAVISEVSEKNQSDTSMTNSPVIQEPLVVEEIAITAEPVKSPLNAVKTEVKKSVGNVDQDEDDSKKTKSKGAKKKKHSNSALDSSQLDNSMLRKITSQFHIDELADEDQPASALRSKKFKKDKKASHQFNRPVKPIQLTVMLPEQISVNDLANQMSLKIIVILKELLKLGIVGQATTMIDRDTATLVVEELGHVAQVFVETDPEDVLDIHYTADLKPRSPVVTIMGHVDHGKTSLLDYIRRSRVAASEAGGITQHIGAYSVATKLGRVTFLDTPGHAAFTAMRARGAQCTDIAVIIVAADDGVMPQTKEAISHAKAAGVPIVVAMNKVDKESADIERVKTQMSQLDVLPEEWGGDSPFIGVSAKTGAGVEELLEALSLQAEILELKAHHEGPAQGIIVESSLSRQKGPVATVLVQEGQLRVGDIIVCGTQYGRIKALSDDLGQPIEIAGPAMPVEILGLSGVVEAGDKLAVVQTEKQAKDIVDFRLLANRPSVTAAGNISLENFFANNKKGKELCIILKADTHGSVEAISDSLKKCATEEVAVKMIAQGVGGITESDIMLAKASSAIILGFNTRADRNSKALADQEQVSIYYYSIIYELLDTVKASIHGLETPKFQEEIVGLAEVRDVFRSSKLGNIAGCLVVDGYVRKDLPIRVLRQNIVIYQGKLESLRRYKDDVAEVRAGTECGIGVKDYNDIKPGDQVEVYRMVEVQRRQVRD